MKINGVEISPEFEELLKAMPPFKKKKPKPELEPAPKVATLATSNPDVPLERQRERLSEAQRRLIEDEKRRLEEWKAQKKHERWLAERQRAIDWHWEHKLVSEEAERRYRDDPSIKLFNETWQVEMKEEREREANRLAWGGDDGDMAEREMRALKLEAKREAKERDAYVHRKVEE